ncbi:sigma-70 family RNA polymerase sigma factor [Zeimonas arvi]|uniref:Sigma-70 family RNA polymerase sigma factor n=1 Tax=Zeimonas arvi TaxID=2498847 RepID=A0A5C8NPP3_9BURK|nr:sigma-70 family RNA polymerase sigma factor [Zeimonas arvi]TXL62413.1 sigma-70 family RNA polymerase sigma factor [Zeimonas arvi]
MARSFQHRDLELASLRARLMRYARLLAADPALAEDLVQETLLAIAEGRAAWRGDASLATWALGILKHKAADWWRSNESRWLTNLDDGGAVDGGPLDSLCRDCPHQGFCAPLGCEPDGVLERRELAEAIARCASRLPARATQVFVLHEWYGFGTDEICERLGLSAPNCRTLLHRARVGLRRCLERDWRPGGGESLSHPASRMPGRSRPIPGR